MFVYFFLSQELTIRFSKEKAELEQNMTLKKDKKRELARKQLMEKEQETTHSLVSKFSKEMINLIQEKELAVLVSLINIHITFFFYRKKEFENIKVLKHFIFIQSTDSLLLLLIEANITILCSII